MIPGDSSNRCLEGAILLQAVLTAACWLGQSPSCSSMRLPPMSPHTTSAAAAKSLPTATQHEALHRPSPLQMGKQQEKGKWP